MTFPRYHNISLKKYCTYNIGGPAKELWIIHKQKQLLAALEEIFSQKKRYFLLGMGSNCLFDDRGFDGVIIINRMRDIIVKDNSLIVDSGYPLTRLGQKASKKGIKSLEFLIGIPGTVGGGIYMNAGCFQQEIQDDLEWAEFIHENGEKIIYPKQDLQFSYRFSIFHQWRGVILRGKFSIHNKKESQERSCDSLKTKKERQPLKEKSCGCIFRNPPGMSAGHLIESLHLKGFSIGGARISSQHANFIINENQATAKDILLIIYHVQHCVLENYGIKLKTECQYIPFQSSDRIDDDPRSILSRKKNI